MKNCRIYISHDCCNDFTWGNDETSTRDNLAEMLRAHLDAMSETDTNEPDERDHYTTTTFVEAICFIEKYPERKAELVRRAIEGRLTLSPWLCNTLWGSMKPESQLRAMNAARRLEIETGAPMNAGNHSEMPSLPIGAVPILAGAGVRWIVLPWLLYDTVWENLDTPPIIRHVGPDGSEVFFIFDRYASRRALYIQGLKILNSPEAIPEWLAHYETWGERYPIDAFFAAGTHHDLYPEKRDEVRPLNEKLAAYNRRPDRVASLVNASLGRFVEEVGKPNEAKFPVERRSFGISWEAWPVGMAKIMADSRIAERAYYDAEALLALASLKKPREREFTEAARKRADDVIAMIGDHAWNGMGERSHRINQHLRRRWAEELQILGETLVERATNAMKDESASDTFTFFNPLGHPRRDVVSIPSVIDFSVSQNWSPLAQQDLCEDGEWTRVALSPVVPGFGIATCHKSNPIPVFNPAKVIPSQMESPFFLLKMDSERPGVSSLIHRASGIELRAGAENIGETLWHAGKNVPISVTGHEVLAHGPVLTRLAQHASAPGISVTSIVTLYSELDYADFDIRIEKTAFGKHERVTQVFPFAERDAVPLVQTPGAFVRAAVAPKGDLHPGADPTRIAADGFAQVVAPGGLKVSVATLESFLLRPDLGPLVVECLGNDQNAPEVSHNQAGETTFRFRYRVRVDPAETPLAPVAQWAADFAHPIQMIAEKTRFPEVSISPDPSRVVTQCLKPALDGRGLMLRFWEVSGLSEGVPLRLSGFSKATVCDLMERDLDTLEIKEGVATVPVRGWGFAGVRLE